MVGFVGTRAKKRKRNFFLSVFLLCIIGVFILIFPTLELDNNTPIPNENIIPDPIEDLNSLASNIEELKLNIFQKDQKIKFRDGQINNLQTELKKTKLQFETIILELNEIKNKYNELSTDNKNLITPNQLKSLQDKFNKLNIENDNNISIIKNLNKNIEDFEKNLLSLDSNKKNISKENQKLKQDNKSLFAKNLKLNQDITNLEKKINDQNFEIELYLEEIKELKDKSHHGG